MFSPYPIEQTKETPKITNEITMIAVLGRTNQNSPKAIIAGTKVSRKSMG